MKSLSGKNILITGGAGFIGSNLIDRLILEKPGKIVVVDNFFLGKMENLEDAQRDYDDLLIVKGDAQDYELMDKVIADNNIEIIFDLATKCLPYSLEQPEDAFTVNADIAVNLLKLIREKKYKTLIHFSSSEVYGTAKQERMSESHVLDPNTTYAAGKAAADLLIMAYLKIYDLDISIIRPFNTYGPRQNKGLYAGVIPITIKRILNGENPILQGTGEQTRDYIYVKDLVNGVIDAYKNENTRGLVMNLATGREVKIKDLVDDICQIMEYKGEIILDSERPGDVLRHCADISLAKKLINFNPETDFKTGLSETIQWYKNQKN